MLFIKMGAVRITVVKGEVEYELGRLESGAHFGELALLADAGRRSTNVLTITYCDFQVLRRRDFEKVSKTFPELMQRLRDSARGRQQISYTSPTKLVSAASSASRVLHVADAPPMGGGPPPQNGGTGTPRRSSDGFLPGREKPSLLRSMTRNDVRRCTRTGAEAERSTAATLLDRVGNLTKSIAEAGEDAKPAPRKSRRWSALRQAVQASQAVQQSEAGVAASASAAARRRTSDDSVCSSAPPSACRHSTAKPCPTPHGSSRGQGSSRGGGAQEDWEGPLAC